MIKYEQTDYATSTKTVVTDYVGRSVYATYETVRVMSDIWENHLVLKSITPEGGLTSSYLAGGYGADERREYAIDATESAFQDYYAARKAYRLSQLQYDDASQADTARKDKMVKVVGGKDKTAKGKIGKVVVVKEMFYGMGYRGSMRNKLGIALDDTMVKRTLANGKTYDNYANMIWVWAHNVEVINPEQYMASPSDIMDRAEQYATDAVANLKRTAAANVRYQPMMAA
jgi:hypothetical protein